MESQPNIAKHPEKEIAKKLIEKLNTINGNPQKLKEWNIETQAFLALFYPKIISEASDSK